MRINVALVAITIVLVGCTLSLAWSAEAQPKGFVIGDKPATLAGTDVYKMEDEAVQQWTAIFPKLVRSKSFDDTWDRLNTHLQSAMEKWSQRMDATHDKEHEEAFEMWSWCLRQKHTIKPSVDDRDAAEKFALLDVRAQLCEAKLPAGKK